jgi:hypothetical protein
MRELVITELMDMIQDGVEVYGADVAPITDRKTLEALSNKELLAILISTVEFQG